MEDERKEYLKFAKQIAYKAGEIMLKYFNLYITIFIKNPLSLK